MIFISYTQLNVSEQCRELCSLSFLRRCHSHRLVPIYCFASYFSNSVCMSHDLLFGRSRGQQTFH